MQMCKPIYIRSLTNFPPSFLIQQIISEGRIERLLIEAQHLQEMCRRHGNKKGLLVEGVKIRSHPICPGLHCQLHASQPVNFFTNTTIFITPSTKLTTFRKQLQARHIYVDLAHENIQDFYLKYWDLCMFPGRNILLTRASQGPVSTTNKNWRLKCRHPSIVMHA